MQEQVNWDNKEETVKPNIEKEGFRDGLTELQKKNLEVMGLLLEEYPHAFNLFIDKEGRPYSILKEKSDSVSNYEDNIYVLCHEGLGLLHIAESPEEIPKDGRQFKAKIRHGEVDISQVIDAFADFDDGHVVVTTVIINNPSDKKPVSFGLAARGGNPSFLEWASHFESDIIETEEYQMSVEKL